MNIWFGHNPPLNNTPCAVTIGNFDGVHNGHRHILQKLQLEANARNLTSVALIFEPQPNEFFAKQRQHTMPYRLSPIRDKLRLLAETGYIDNVWVVRFNQQFASMSAATFIDHVLRKKLNTQYLLIGDDFRFGSQRGGDFALLKAQPDFVTERTPSILVAGTRASSTAIRTELQHGNLTNATHILGHNYSLSGRVKHGAKLGRTIGCPTANVNLPSHHYPLNGVFVVNVSGSFGTRRGVASLGTNPTVSQSLETKLEVHLFDFSGSLYGQRIQVDFIHKLRDEQKFDNWTQLKQQIWTDMAQARNW